MLKPLSFLFKGSLILRIMVAIVIAIVVHLIAPVFSGKLGILGTLFVTLLRAIAPVLVFILLINSIIKADTGSNKTIKSIVTLYIVSSVIAAFLSAFVTFLSPEIHLNLGDIDGSGVNLAKESSALEVLQTQFLRMFENPVAALVNANFLALLAWSVAFGVALRYASVPTKAIINDLSEAVSKIVAWIVQLAPFGVFGILCDTLSNQGVGEILKYGQLIVVLMVAFAVLAFVYFPIVGFIIARRNTFPLLLKCLAISGIPAFFSRSSAANIPVNMDACKRFGLSEKVASFTIPLGANINLTAAAATITVLSITAANSLGLGLDFVTVAISCAVAALCAIGCSGVPGGSLIMIPIAASILGVPPEIASKMVAIGFLIGVIQDSVETAINSAGDLYYTALVCEKYNAYAENDEVEAAA